MTRRVPPRRSLGGFTLLELIIALVLSSMVVLVSTAALSGAIDSYSRSRTRVESHEDTRAAQRTLRVEWEARTSGRVESGGTWLAFDTRRLAFSEPLADGRRVRYRCEIEEGSGRFVLWHDLLAPRRPPGGAPPGGPGPVSPPVDGMAQAPTSGQSTRPQSGERDPLRVVASERLVDHLSECGFSVLQMVAAGKKNVPSWVPVWDGAGPAPAAARMVLSPRRAALPPFVVVARE